MHADISVQWLHPSRANARQAPKPPQSPPQSSLPTVESARRLMLLLAIGNPDFVSKLEPAFSGQMSPRQVMAALEPVAERALREAAAPLALGLGAEIAEVLRFCSDTGGRASAIGELRGRNGTLRRFDRLWGGPMLAQIEAHAELHYSMLLRSQARWLVTRGTVWIHPARSTPALAAAAAAAPQPVPPYTTFQLSPWQELVMAPGAVVLLRRGPVNTLLEAVQEAGLPVDRLVAAAGQPAISIPTPLGPLGFDRQHRTACIHGRTVRLTHAECEVFSALCHTPGVISARTALAARLCMKGRNIDRIMVQLRNKLGDGLITTVYGAGYLLEVEAVEVAAAIAPD